MQHNKLSLPQINQFPINIHSVFVHTTIYPAFYVFTMILYIKNTKSSTNAINMHFVKHDEQKPRFILTQRGNNNDRQQISINAVL